MPQVMNPSPGIFANDWYAPPAEAFPRTTNYSAYPPSVPQQTYEVPPQIPVGSYYSPSRNVWLLQDGRMIPAGNFRPLPPDKNTYSPNDVSSWRAGAPSWAKQERS